MKKLFVGVAALLLAAPASAQVSVVVGVASSINLGERPGIVLGLRTGKKGLVTLNNVAFFDSSPKETGGFKAGESFTLRFGKGVGFIAGADFRYRDGGVWRKKTVWSVSGFGWRNEQGDVYFLYKHPLFESYPNHVRMVQMDAYLRKPTARFGLLVTEGLVIYRDYTGLPQRYGWFQNIGLSVALKK